MADLTDDDLKRLEEMEAKATRGPWERRGTLIGAGNELIAGARGTIFGVAEDDAELIVAMRNSLPGLLRELRFLRHVPRG